MDGIATVLFFDPNPPDHGTVAETVATVCGDLGFVAVGSGESVKTSLDSSTTSAEIRGPTDRPGEETGTLYIGIERQDTDRDITEPFLDIGTSVKYLSPEQDKTETDDGFTEIYIALVQRLAVEFNPVYVTTVGPVHNQPETSPESVLPAEDGIDLDRLPWLGIYSESLVERFGGRERVLDTPAWRIEELDNGSILLITTKMPWENYNERQPADKYLLDGEDIPAEEDDTGRTQLGLTDPFAALDPGEYGAEVGVHPEMVGEVFRNEDLQLLRVRRDEDGALRRTDDEAVVRRVVSDTSGDDHDIVGRQFEFLPPDATDEDRRGSALLHPDIPPSFVQLDSPTDENVVTRVMNLDVETDKIPLLISLGQAAKQVGSGHDADSIESALDHLYDLEDVAGIEQWIEDNLI